MSLIPENQTRRFKIFESFNIEFDDTGDYILCNECHEKIGWGKDMIHFANNFYHKICWDDVCCVGTNKQTTLKH